MNIKKNIKKWVFLTVILSAICIETVSAARLHSCQTAATSSPVLVSTIHAEGQEVAPVDPGEPEGLLETIMTDDQLGITIEGALGKDGNYHNLSLHTPMFQCTLPGTQVSNPSYAPLISEADLDGDGQQEIIVNLTYGYGTGAYLNAIQVFRQNGESIPVEPLSNSVQRQFTTELEASSIQLHVNDRVTTIPLERFTQPPAANEQNYIHGGDVQQYTVEDNQIHAAYSLQAGTSEFIGELDAVYRYDKGMLRLQPLTLQLDDPYREAPKAQ
ncbi:hypothetical protein [Paenibacillus wulumuqiensis]|uniref:hypothetical protein n=1 Tax=Paenibacillus wulumuqiensis TaxID=1567107 RepID=UPI000619B14F|nr:hypothetical protein [Paenibacillus wulumuqiensis]